MSAIETPSGKNEASENFPVERHLRADLRPHVKAYYIFARAADDIADNPLLDPADKIARLDAFASCLTNGEDDGVKSVLPLKESLAQTGVTARHALDLLTAFKQDAIKTRYENWDELLEYCRYSANPVGRYLLDLHGEAQKAREANDALCTALQILNHVQDCADDYRELDRVYIPEDILARRGIDPSALAAEKASPELRAALDDLLDLTAPLIDKAKDFPSMIGDRRLRLNAAVICVVAERLAAFLRRRDPLSENVKLSRFAKFAAFCVGLKRAFAR